MGAPAEIHQKQLETIKKRINQYRMFFSKNYTRFHQARRFWFYSALSDDDIAVLSSLSKPQFEFNIGEPYVSRLLGEFAEMEPAFSVSASNTDHIDMQMIKIVEGHVRHSLFESNQDATEYHGFKDCLSGGFSAMKVWTEYENSNSFEHLLRFSKVKDPTLVGFDPLAMTATKSDGRFCFELYPKTIDEIKDKYTWVDWDQIKFSQNIGNYSWAFKDGNEEIILMADYYEKKIKREPIVRLANNRVVTKRKYKEYIQQWQEAGHIEQPAQIVQERVADFTSINRYILIDNQVLEFEETDYEDLPYIFVDGNSITLRNGESGPIEQVTKPLCYNLEGAQKLKNYAGQTLGAELQNMVQHKWIVAKESIPPQYADAYSNNQVPSVIVYNQYKDNNPNIPVNPPREVQRPPIPQEIMSTFMAMDGLAQTILGSYDASLGINDNQLSGKAMEIGATISNAVSKPYLVGYLQALNQVAKMFVNLIPKLYVTARTIPVLDADAKRSFVRINDEKDPNSMKLEYDGNALNVNIEAGASFQMQKTKALNQMISASQAMPIFGQFMNEKGLGVFVSNFEIKDGDQLKLMADDYMQELAQQKQQAQQMQQQQMQNNPIIMKNQLSQKELQLREQKQQHDMTLDAAKASVSAQQTENERLRILMEAKQNNADNLVAMEKQQTEKVRAATDLALNMAKHEHERRKDAAELHHKITSTHLKHQKDILV